MAHSQQSVISYRLKTSEEPPILSVLLFHLGDIQARRIMVAHGGVLEKGLTLNRFY
jgi:hypothetical protein